MTAVESSRDLPVQLSQQMRSAGAARRARRDPEDDAIPVVLARELRRWFFLNRPTAYLWLAGGACSLLFVLDLIPGSSAVLGAAASHHEVAASLFEHLLIVLLGGAFAYYKLLGAKRERVLRSYRDRALHDPEGMVEWYTGIGTGLRERASKRLGEEIIHSKKATVTIVKGREGTGRTSFIVELVKYLAERKLVPIPILVQPGGDFDLDRLAREKFSRNVQPVTSAEESEAIWQYARQTRAIVVLVDGLTKEVIEELKRDRGKGVNAIRHFQENRVDVVLATTLDLESELDHDNVLHLLDEPAFGSDGAGPHRSDDASQASVLREDLDRFTHEEAVAYVQHALSAPKQVVAARAALDRLHDPSDDSLVDPFYLDVIVRLAGKDVSLDGLPDQTDHWRAALLRTYLTAIADERMLDSRDRGSDNPHRARLHRGSDAYAAAAKLAERLDLEVSTAVDKRELEDVSEETLQDAEELNLLRNGAEYVAFTSDDLGAYMVAERERDSLALLETVRHIDEGRLAGTRRARYGLTAFTFWCLQQNSAERHDAFAELLDLLGRSPNKRPRLAAAAVRILVSCAELGCYESRVVPIVDSCIDGLDPRQGWHDRAADPRGALRLVRALARWHVPEAHRLLWRLATSRYLTVEWPAVKALAASPADTVRNLGGSIDAVLEIPAVRESADELSDERNTAGNELASVAWLLPALREPGAPATSAVEARWARVRRTCLASKLSPLRGEMALAQGLKLAMLHGRDDSLWDVHELLFATPLRFWHARLVLSQALFAYAWRHPDKCEYFRTRFEALYSREPHRLAKRAIELALHGLEELATETEEGASEGSAPTLLAHGGMYEYIWKHEHDAVAWVERSRWKVSRLAADVVLLSNMTYRQWALADAANPGAAPAAPSLPSCIRNCTTRMRIIDGGQGSCACPHRLCAHREPPAFEGTWARFTKSFCQEQARLAIQHGPPLWTRGRIPFMRHTRQLAEYWSRQAAQIPKDAGPTLPASSAPADGRRPAEGDPTAALATSPG